MNILRIYRNKTASRLFFLGLTLIFLIYISIYSINYVEYNKTLEISRVNIKCINKVCVEYSGIMECIDIPDPYVFKVSFNENFNVSSAHKVYSIDLLSLGKKCSEE